MSNAIPRPHKCRIVNLEHNNAYIEAFFNPKEVAIDKKVPWNKHKSTKANVPELEFTDAEPQQMQLELLFDTYESRRSVHSDYVAVLESFMKIVPDLKRPPMCLFLWGQNFPSFMGVIESLSTKYTMFLPDGTPVRATVSLSMKQADVLIGSGTGEGDKKKDGPTTDFTTPGKVATIADAKRADKFGPNHRQTLEDSRSENGTLQPGEMIFGAPGK